RESLSHFEYLKYNNSEEFKIWVKENEKKIFNKESFIESFNDSMNEKEKRKDRKLIYTFKKYGRWWIKNQKESERPYVMPAYLKTIS
ncbi:hypothetical protein ACNKXS_03625, partial [Christiangramia marina]|uniref:hypothetical protein n=1 Tax=Christiangramia marina TaxID=409436 RepID=UPI003AA9D820